MLRFACNRLIRSQWENERDAWVYLESFLVHYRNLIEFLGKQQDRIKRGDIHITTLWGLEGLTTPSWATQIHAKGQTLWVKYEEHDDRISRYLQHCTTKRIDAKDWQIDEMVNEIEPLLREIEKAVKPTNNLLEGIRAVPAMVAHSASTTVATSTAVLPILPGAEHPPKL
jgi:hypothetical protein